MKEGPDISTVASLIGDPGRAQMLLALMDRRALTATELSVEAGITKQTASGHLSKLLDGGLVTAVKEGRHRYFQLGDDDVAGVIEALMGVAARKTGTRVRTGPKDPALRQARVCYDHLAGEMGVMALDRMRERGWISGNEETLTLTAKGRTAFADFGINLEINPKSRRPECRPCLDWSMRRHHLGGHAGKALLDRLIATKKVKRDGASRALLFTSAGRKEFEHWLGTPQ